MDHIFDRADDLALVLPNHIHTPVRHCLSQLLWWRDNDDTIEWEREKNCYWHVRCASRNVNNKVIKVSPVGVVIKLFKRAVDHRAAPDKRFALMFLEDVE